MIYDMTIHVIHTYDSAAIALLFLYRLMPPLLLTLSYILMTAGPLNDDPCMLLAACLLLLYRCIVLKILQTAVIIIECFLFPEIVALQRIGQSIRCNPSWCNQSR